ncbi:alpha/beta hydrolase [Halalkalibacter urbisdiaboli]|uniref:alpha/beta hydrolase n=1 Tax=Halalkalibacter urbisdiaboli TaxID=1960589 RepID=UPI000B437910|nr:alpha/beta hydrolase [Halalkalibacter urbisdiaboli]
MEQLLWPEGAPNALGTSDEDKPTITAYLVEGEQRPCVIVCPGGGYRSRANHEGEPIAKWLNSLGISAFVLKYRVAPYRYPNAKLDVQRAIRTVRYQASQFKIDPTKLGVLGFSAGGHLAATAGTSFDFGRANDEDPVEQMSSRPDLLVLCYPVITMKEPFLHEGSRYHLLGENPSNEEIALLSQETQVTEETPPTFLWHTSDDASVPVENSLQFAVGLRKHRVLFDLHVYSTGRHGLGLAESESHSSLWTNACESWFRFTEFISNKKY